MYVQMQHRYVSSRQPFNHCPNIFRARGMCVIEHDARSKSKAFLSNQYQVLLFNVMLFCLPPDNVQHELQLRPLINIAWKKKKIALETKPKTSLTAKPTTTLKANPKKHVVR